MEEEVGGVQPTLHLQQVQQAEVVAAAVAAVAIHQVDPLDQTSWQRLQYPRAVVRTTSSVTQGGKVHKVLVVAEALVPLGAAGAREVTGSIKLSMDQIPIFFLQSTAVRSPLSRRLFRVTITLEQVEVEEHGQVDLGQWQGAMAVEDRVDAILDHLTSLGARDCPTQAVVVEVDNTEESRDLLVAQALLCYDTHNAVPVLQARMALVQARALLAQQVHTVQQGHPCAPHAPPTHGPPLALVNAQRMPGTTIWGPVRWRTTASTRAISLPIRLG